MYISYQWMTLMGEWHWRRSNRSGWTDYTFVAGEISVTYPLTSSRDPKPILHTWKYTRRYCRPWWWPKLVHSYAPYCLKTRVIFVMFSLVVKLWGHDQKRKANLMIYMCACGVWYHWDLVSRAPMRGQRTRCQRQFSIHHPTNALQYPHHVRFNVQHFQVLF